MEAVDNSLPNGHKIAVGKHSPKIVGVLCPDGFRIDSNLFYHSDWINVSPSFGKRLTLLVKEKAIPTNIVCVD